ncbi:MAG: DJ-1/PfpI family protein [Chlorobi bacterium]|nr:DJ-1/PfpI family protein [Chlorobiota bacterium]
MIVFLSIVQTGNIKAQDKAETKVYNVAVLVYDSIYLLDFAGPLEVFADSFSKDGKHLFNVYTVAPDSGSIRAHTGLVVTPDYTLEDMPAPDIFVVPGGNLGLLNGNDKLKKQIIETSNQSDMVLSVCTGAFILSAAGLLDGMEATTWYGAVDRLQKITPKAKVVKNKRITINEKLITTAGVSAGIDGALHIVGKLFGKETAAATAKYIEYDCWSE